MVYLNAKDATSRDPVSPMVSGAFRHAKMGRIIPQAVVSSADQTQIFSKMSYNQLKVSSEYSVTSKAVKSALGGEEFQGDSTIVPYWNLKNSMKAYAGPFVELKDDSVLVYQKRDGGANSSIELAKLSAGSQAYARLLESQKSGGTKSSELTEEFWESAKDGKTIKATFVSLKGDTITLKKDSGKSVSFSVQLLSEKSQTRAKELAGKL